MEQTDLHPPNTSYRAGMHTLGDNTEGEEDTNLLTIDEDINERNQTNEDVEDNDLTNKLLVSNGKRKDQHTDTPQLGQEESTKDMDGVGFSSSVL